MNFRIGTTGTPNLNGIHSVDKLTNRRIYGGFVCGKIQDTKCKLQLAICLPYFVVCAHRLDKVAGLITIDVVSVLC